jgi:hypothetical protein
LADPVLVVAWLVLAHLVGDFILQTEAMVRDKNRPGARGWRGLLTHGGAVALCLVPVALVFGVRGLALLVVVAVTHVLIDRWKVRATRHAEAEALADAHRRHEETGSTNGLGPAWTPIPGALFIVDQLAHVVVSLVAWLVFIANAPLSADAVALIDRVLGGTDRATVHAGTMVVVVGASLVIVNVRAAALFVATLVHPRALVTGDVAAEELVVAPPARPWWQIRLGPFVATAEPSASAAPVGHRPAPAASGYAPPARLGATIGVLERLLIVTLVLANATAAIGLVIAAKTLARFKQLDDRDFAEYYLLGTLASVGVAIGSALIADGALATVGL